MFPSEQENAEYISAALCGLKDMKNETAMNYPSQTVMKKEIMGQSGIDISKWKGFPIWKQFSHYILQQI